MNDQLGEICVSFCGACGERLRWEQRAGSSFECWVGSCDCGWLRVLHIQEREEKS
jgi:hypothetical protein